MKELYQLTHSQKNIWYTEKTHPGTSIGNVAGTLRIKDNVDFVALGKAINKFVEQNDGMRLQVLEKEGVPYQYVKDYEEFKVDFVDFSDKSIEELYKFEEEQTRGEFRLLDAPLFDFKMIKLSNDDGGFYLKTHHLISDAWNMSLIGNEITKNYIKILNQKMDFEERTSYIEHIKEETEYINSEKYKMDREYWHEKYKFNPEVTILKPKNKKEISTKANRKSFVLPEKLIRCMNEYAKREKISVYAMYMTALSMYINRVTGKDEINLGTVFLNRKNKSEKETVGMFVSTVPVSFSIDSKENFDEFSKKVTNELRIAMRHQRYPFNILQQEIRDKFKTDEGLYDIVLSYQNAKFNKYEGIERKSKWHFCGHQANGLTIHINDRDDTEEIIVEYDYLKDIFFAKEIEFMHRHIVSLLWHAIDNPSREISKIEMVSESGKKKILYDFNDTEAKYPDKVCVHQIFEEIAEKHPNNIAVKCGKNQITYKELNEKSNRLANLLRKKGIKTETIVALLLHRNINMIVAILAVQKAGGAYLPIDPDYPDERKKYIIEDSKVDFIISEKEIIENSCYTQNILDVEDEEINLYDAKNLECSTSPDNLIYIIYTSGSTGNPKGAMLEHKNVVRLLYNDKFQFKFSSKDVWSMFHSYCFDFSVWEMYGALLYGGKLVIIPKEEIRETDKFLSTLKLEKVTVLNQTPAAFYNLINEEMKHDDKALNLRYIVFGGEALKPIKLKEFHEKYPNTKLINMYGITETTVHVTYKEIGEEEINKNISNIGRPIPTLKTYILDSNLNILPIGIPGELCVSGLGVGRGYLERDKLTAQKFIKNPYNENEILYRSGDLARWFAQGEMEYLGRIDNQVKIRGHRIEIGEIENVLLSHENIKEVLVMAQDTEEGSKRLCAYFVANKTLSTGIVKEFLLKKIPEYMIPSFFIQISQMPLTKNGKVDRRALPNPSEHLCLETEYVEPCTKLQEEIEKIWSEVLNIEKIGINDNFFEIGGDSLNSITILAKLNKNVTFADLYENPTIKLLAEKIENNDEKNKILLNLTPDIKSNSKIICFPYAGGNSITYRELAESLKELKSEYCVYSINLPGHDIGKEEEFKKIEDLAKKIANEICKNTDNIILYGHCVGSALTMATANELKKSDAKIKNIVIGGILPPDISGIFGKSIDPWKFISNEVIVKQLQKIGLPEIDDNKEYRDFIMNAFRNDVKEYYRYFYENKDVKFDATVKFLVGTKDPMTVGYKHNYKKWGKYFENVKLYELGGANHYFIKTNSDEVADIILED